MGIFDKVKKTTIASRRYEEKLYEVALEEFENGEIRKGLYAKALSMADGNKEKAEGIYLKLRVKSIMDDIESERINRRENARAYKALQELREEESIDEFMSRPSETLINELGKLKGNIMILGVGGKMGPTLARLAKRAAPDKKIFGVARFTDTGLQEKLEYWGIDTFKADLLDSEALGKLPNPENIIFSKKTFGLF